MCQPKIVASQWCGFGDGLMPVLPLALDELVGVPMPWQEGADTLVLYPTTIDSSCDITVYADEAGNLPLVLMTQNTEHPIAFPIDPTSYQRIRLKASAPGGVVVQLEQRQSKGGCRG